ncbi:39S ribosomal protein L55, mitochondrial isoform X2 [Grus americana]|uniref:39S ribosomal protein L55, mitochondrial isoform X2 n=2 Tax=Grus americana TaxID=9117 RepID=UPI0024077CEE|nr:39S ribosomal protein L55, mitochondrial isoform X2 [Grus americana]
MVGLTDDGDGARGCAPTAVSPRRAPCPQAAASPPAPSAWAYVEDLACTGMAAAGRALSALRLDAIPRLLPPMSTSSRSNSNRASISHLHRQLYGRLYPVLLVKTDGSTVRLRYKEPKRILMLPLDSSTLPEAERKARLRRQFPSKPKAAVEETFEGIDLGTYKRFWKK